MADYGNKLHILRGMRAPQALFTLRASPANWASAHRRWFLVSLRVRVLYLVGGGLDAGLSAQRQ